ncbi:MAG TPA: nuclear transport factor 2 family protein [Candidatus Limnocylindria bacterium]
MGNRRVVDRWVEALEADDLAAQRALLHDEFVGRYPQSGEVIRGPDNRIAIVAGYPDWDRTSGPVKVETITGTDDQFVSAPSGIGWSIVHLSGSDDEFTITGAVRYPDGSVWHVVGLLIVRDGKIWRETSYFAEPFEAADWRAQYVEREQPQAT